MDGLRTAYSLFSQGAPGVLDFLKILGLLVSLGFLGGIIYTIFEKMNTNDRVKEKRTEHAKQNFPEVSPQQKRWQEIGMMFKSQNSTDWRMAIIDADTMLEDMILGLGYQGETFGEKLKNLQRDGIPWTDAAWDVHLLRNKLAHEGSRYPLTDREAFRAYKIYENILVGNGYLA